MWLFTSIFCIDRFACFIAPHFVCQFLVIANIKIWLLGIVSI